MTGEQETGDQPPGSAFASVSTLDQRPDQRFEFWRSLFPLIELDISDKSRIRQFKARLMRYQAPDGCVFGFGANDNTHARFARPESDFVLLNLTLSGRAELELSGDRRHVVDAASGLLALDGTRPFRTKSYGHATLWMTLPRDMVAAIAGEETGVLKDGLAFLPQNGLSRILEAHLQMIAREGDGMDRRSAELALKVATDLALGALSRTRDALDAEPDRPHDSAIFTAALRHIRARTSQLDLTAAAIADAIGCSRARLYRVFAANGRAVGDAIRNARIELASTQLVNRPDTPVKQIAHSCGYADAAAFARAFRAATGLTPSDFRERHHETDR